MSFNKDLPQRSGQMDKSSGPQLTAPAGRRAVEGLSLSTLDEALFTDVVHGEHWIVLDEVILTDKSDKLLRVH